MKDKVVWCLVEDDFRGIIQEDYPEFTVAQVEELIQIAYYKFSIHDWVEHVEAFIDVYKDRVLG